MAPTSPRPSSPQHNLPFHLTSLIGRSRELDGVRAALRRTRLVTLTGPGGVGKTRLALELAHGQVTRHSDGAWLVELAAGTGTPDVAAETARALGVTTPRGTAPAAALRESLAGRDLLLVLDNCEHVLEACAELAAALLASCADLRILATSRETLGVSGETVWRLEPLTAEDAYRLFVERARQREPAFMPGGEVDETIAELCARLDRLPFAIELAAARVSALSPQEVLAGLEAHLGAGALAGSGSLSPAQHRTVRGAVEWSHQLLDPAERQAFRALSVLVGDLRRRRGGGRRPGPHARRARATGRQVPRVGGERQGRGTRYRLLETVREYAGELLLEAGELDAARERLLRHFTVLADVAREEWLTTGRQRFVNELDDDYESIRAAAGMGLGLGSVHRLADARRRRETSSSASARTTAFAWRRRCSSAARDAIVIERRRSSRPDSSR